MNSINFHARILQDKLLGLPYFIPLDHFSCLTEQMITELTQYWEWKNSKTVFIQSIQCDNYGQLNSILIHNFGSKLFFKPFSVPIFSLGMGGQVALIWSLQHLLFSRTKSWIATKCKRSWVYRLNTFSTILINLSRSY